MARQSYGGDVWDANSTCNVLWVSRSHAFNFEAWAGRPLVVEIISQIRRGGAKASWLGLGPDNDVIACNWNKDTTSPAGVFSITLKPRQDYLKLLHPGDLIFIYMSDNAPHQYSTRKEQVGTLVTVGIIDRVSQSVSVSGDGADMKMVHVSGRDFGVILQETSTVFDNAFSVVEQSFFSDAYFTSLLREQNALTPVETIYKILRLFYDENASGSKLVGAQWKFVDDTLGRSVPLVSLMDVTTFVQTPVFGYRVADGVAIGQAGNVWSLLESYANRVVNEMFVDVRDFTKAERDFISYLNSVASAYVSEDDLTNQQASQFTMKSDSIFTTAYGRLTYEEVERRAKGDEAKIQDIIADEAALLDTEGTGLTTEEERPPGVPRTREGAPVVALVMRQLPYDTDAFYNLPGVRVEQTELFETDVGYAAHEAFNFFRIRFPDLQNCDEFLELTYGIPVNVDTIFKHGIRRLEAESRYMFASSEASTTFDDGKRGQPDDFSVVFDYYLGLLSTWYAANEYMLSGSITMRFRPEIRVGTRLSVDMGSATYDFYIQGVSHSFAVEAGSSRTTLTVIRGVKSGGKGLENNLRWTTNGPALPPQFNTFIRTTAGGFDFDTARGLKVISDQRASEVARIDTASPVSSPSEEDEP